jgi:hypothetical protein
LFRLQIDHRQCKRSLVFYFPEVTAPLPASVSVKMKGGVKPLMDEPVTLMGTLKVGETRENGYLVGIYAMDGDKMAERN